MNDRPTAVELLAAARQFIETNLIPTLSDARLRFQTLITANVLAIVERELQTEESQLLEEWRYLAEILDIAESPPDRLQELRTGVRRANETLGERIRQGEFDEPLQFSGLAKQLKSVVVRKLEVANPRYLASFRDGS